MSVKVLNNLTVYSNGEQSSGRSGFPEPQGDPSLEAPPCKKQKTSPCSTDIPMPDGQETLKQRKLYVASSQKLHFRDYPLKIVRSKGQYFWDENGRRYLDTVNNVSHVGHCNEKVVEACTAQMSVLNTNSRFLYDNIVTYAQHLCSKFPEKLNCCFFTNSGSEANDLALQICQVVTGFPHVVALEGAYHGHLMSLKQLSSHKLSKGTHFAGQHVSIAPLPDSYRGKYTDPDTAGKLYAEDCVELMESKEVAAFIHESILSCGGQVVLPKGYLQEVYRHVHSKGGLCIADEVQTGFGRVGDHFWAFESHDVCPDIVTVGKPMGNGHPVSAVITTREIADKFAACGVEYFNTFGGNPVSMAVAEAVLTVVEEDKLQSHAKEMGEFLTKRFIALKDKYSCIGDVRGTGLFLGLDFVKDPETKEPNSATANAVKKHMLHNYQIIAQVDGIHDNVIKIKPPMVITREDCENIVKAIDEVLAKLHES